MSCVASMILLISFNSKDESAPVEQSYVSFIEEWEVTDPDGNTFIEHPGYRDDRLYEADFTIAANLPDDIPDASFVCFINRCETKVYIGDELRYDFDHFRDMPLKGGTVKNFYVLVPVNNVDSGKTITIVRGKVDRRNEVVPETFVAGRDGMYEVLVKKYGVTFIISVLLLFVSTLVVFVGIGMRLTYKHSISMLYAALGVFITSAWLITNSYIYPFVFGHYHIDGVINYLMCMLMPIGYLLYIDSVQKGRYSRVFSVLTGVSILSTLVWTTLHFTGIFPFPHALIYIDTIIAIDIAVAFAMVTTDIFRGNVREYLFTTIGFIGFFFIAIFEIVVILFIPTAHEEIPMILGLAFLLAFVLIQQVTDLGNITAERERAVQLSNAKTAFLANMSHEIRTPINSILGMNEMIIRENRDKKIDEYANNVQTSGKMLLSLVNDVLDFSQLEAGRMTITHEPVFLSSILSDISVMSRERAESKKLSFETVLEGEIPDGIETDEVRIKQVLINLINNAIKYTDEGRVELNVGGRYLSEDSYELRLSVKDTGRGIKEEDKAHLFDAFSRADLTRNRNIEGTGLGLAIVKRILDAMGGVIMVESKYMEGSTFDVLLPVKVTDTTPLRPDFESAERKLEREKPAIEYSAPDARILAVDDNHSNLEIVRMFLNRVDIRPALCRGGREAVEMCCDHKYDLILLDHMMPEIDGIEALKMIRTDRHSINKKTPALVVTANAVPGSERMYMAAGFAGYLTKPINSQKLIDTVRSFIPDEKILKKEEEVPGMIPAEAPNESDLIRKLRGIKEMDVDSAMINCGGDEGILEVVITDIVAEHKDRADKLRTLARSHDYRDYGVEAHALKGLMATIGLMELSDRARKHEFAAKDGNHAFIESDYEGFISEYEYICEKMA
ncbi:MAG: response regulator [Lachnospiraceae bacterium]|nr:response regulator [Lachnospiraceae bacterium]